MSRSGVCQRVSLRSHSSAGTEQLGPAREIAAMVSAAVEAAAAAVIAALAAVAIAAAAAAAVRWSQWALAAECLATWAAAADVSVGERLVLATAAGVSMYITI